MHLADYLKNHGLTLAQFALLIGRTPATVSRIARGRQNPDRATIDAIRTATGGAVQPNDFYPAPADRQAAPSPEAAA